MGKSHLKSGARCFFRRICLPGSMTPGYLVRINGAPFFFVGSPFELASVPYAVSVSPPPSGRGLMRVIFSRKAVKFGIGAILVLMLQGFRGHGSARAECSHFSRSEASLQTSKSLADLSELITGRPASAIKVSSHPIAPIDPTPSPPRPCSGPSCSGQVPLPVSSATFSLRVPIDVLSLVSQILLPVQHSVRCDGNSREISPSPDLVSSVFHPPRVIA
jgi:hypothetical protein